MYADVHNTCLTYSPAHAWCSQHLSKCVHTLRKNAHALVHARLCHAAEASFPWKLLRNCLESCASIVQAVVCRPPCLLSRRNQSPNGVRSRNSSKSMLAHDAVAAAVSHKHDRIIRVGAGLIRFVYRSHSRLAAGLTSSKFLFPPSFRSIRRENTAQFTKK